MTETPVFHPLAAMHSPDHWRHRLTASLGTVSTYPADTWVRARRLFREVTAQSRALLRSPLEFAILRELADRALQLSQLAFDELNASADAAGLSADPQTVTDLLEDNRRILHTIAAQQRLLASIRAQSEPLETWTQSALQGQPTGSRWLSWSEDWLAQSAEDSAPALLPLVGVFMEEVLPAADWNRPGWTVHALTSARLAATVAPRVLDHDPLGRRWLTMAALVQDLALWNWRDETSRNRKRLTYEYHPATGAGLLSNDAECPSEVALLVGLHEERNDGSGSPQRIAAPRLPSRSQWLGLVSRYADFIQAPECHAEAIAESLPLSVVAGLHLWREVRRGAFREDFARAFLDAVEPALATRVVECSAARSQLFIDRQHGVPEPHQGQRAPTPTEAVPGPMFLRRRSGATRLAYAAAAARGDAP